jgi:glucose-6-phosphate-specific signal transduction histidine kinase
VFQNGLITFGTLYYRFLMLYSRNSAPEERNHVKRVWNRVSNFVVVLSSATVLLVIASQFYPFLYDFDEQNLYYRLPASVLQQVIPGVCMAVLLFFAFKYRKYLYREDFSCLVFCCILAGISALSMALSYRISMSVFVSDICAILMFISFESLGSRKAAENEIALAEKDAAIAHQKIRIMQNQIRPHFIFNSLLAIKQLCTEEPQTAANALQHFSTYLRMNLDAMTDERLVPFDREVECIREYVALEQADPANEFEVLYELEFMDFRLPLLTVEPMVENAIRHGLASRKKDGIVKVRSYREGDHAVILVEDNGSGYGSETRQQAEHRSIGIQNAKDRLAMQCKGELSIINTGRGTIVKIDIPLPVESLTGEHGTEEDGNEKPEN